MLLSVSAWAGNMYLNGTTKGAITDINFVGPTSITGQSKKTIDITQITPASSTTAIAAYTCTAGALNSCSCYTTTNAAKIGAIKITVNGSTQWLRTYQDPN
jgi:hypothetical protein